MKTPLLAAALGALALSGCMSGYGYGGGPVGYAGVDYGGYYDGFYGPYAGGYWGDGDVFFYRDQTGRYVPDRDHHFSRKQGGSYTNAIRGEPRPKGDHREHPDSNQHP
jgi:hypothetical protein